MIGGLTLASILLMAGVTPAHAQKGDDVVIMRRALARPNKAVAEPNRWVLGQAVVTPGCSASSPSIAPVVCTSANGRTLPDASCDSTTRPSGRGTAVNYATCTYRWVSGVYSPPSPTCSSAAVKTRTVSCQRQDADLTVVDASFCDPADPGARTTETVAYYAGCGYSIGSWTSGTPNSKCSSAPIRTDVAASCVRAAMGGGAVPSAATLQECRDAGVATTRDVTLPADYSGCSYTATYDQTAACQPDIDGNGKKTVTMTSCRRSDSDSTIVANSYCGSQTQTVSCSLPPNSVSCSAFATGKAPGQFTARYTLGSASTLAQATTMCNNEAKSRKATGYCTWNNANVYNAGWPPYEVNYVVGGTYTSQSVWSDQTKAALNTMACVAK